MKTITVFGVCAAAAALIVTTSAFAKGGGGRGGGGFSSARSVSTVRAAPAPRPAAPVAQYRTKQDTQRATSTSTPWYLFGSRGSSNDECRDDKQRAGRKGDKC